MVASVLPRKNVAMLEVNRAVLDTPLNRKHS